MILSYALIPLNVLILGLMLFFFIAFRKEKEDEGKIKEQIEIIKKTYDERAKESEQMANEAKQKMDEALTQAKKAEEESQKINNECDIKLNKMQEDMNKKMQELQTLEDTMRSEASERIKEFEKEQREEVEKNMVSLVMNVTQKIFEKTLSYNDHKEIIEKSLDEMRFEE